MEQTPPIGTGEKRLGALILDQVHSLLTLSFSMLNGGGEAYFSEPSEDCIYALHLVGETLGEDPGLAILGLPTLGQTLGTRGRIRTSHPWL